MSQRTGDAPPLPTYVDPALLDKYQEVAGDAHCVQCDYNLRGLPAAGRCPECGAAAADSLRGDSLARAEPAYLERLASGLQCLGTATCLLAILSALLGGAILVALLTSGSDVADVVLVTAVAVAAIFGIVSVTAVLPTVVLLTTPRPGARWREGWFSLRRVNRLSPWVTIAVLIAGLCVPPFLGLGALTGAATLVLLWLTVRDVLKRVGAGRSLENWGTFLVFEIGWIVLAASVIAVGPVVWASWILLTVLAGLQSLALICGALALHGGFKALRNLQPEPTYSSS